MNDFDPYQYAEDHFGETLCVMTDDERDGIYSYGNADDLIEYMHSFYERT